MLLNSANITAEMNALRKLILNNNGQPPKFTTAQRDAMFVKAGFTIYNTDLKKVQTWDGGNWQDHW